MSSIDYRVGTYAAFMRSMMASLGTTDSPALQQLGTRDRDDFSIALLDAWAVTCDVLSFYSERLQQGTYLPTARGRIALQELARLIGYRLRPGLSAETFVAFAIEPPPEEPPTRSEDPGSAPPVMPPVVTLEPGLRIQSVPGPGEQPQTFETVERIEARPEWNALRARQSLPPRPDQGDTHAYVRGEAPNLKAGDAVLLKAPGEDVRHERWDVRILAAVTPDAAAGRARIDWPTPLGSVTPPSLPAQSPDAYVLRKRLNVFGHNAPMWKSMSAEFRAAYWPSSPNRQDWPEFTISAGGGTTVDLDGSHPDVTPGSWVVLSVPNYRELWQVEDAVELSRAQFGISGKVTRLSLRGGEHFAFFGTPRETTVLAVSEPIELAEVPDDTDVFGDAVDVEADVSEMIRGRRLVVRGDTVEGDAVAEVVELRAVQPTPEGWRLIFEEELSVRYERASVVIHGNVVASNHGETVDHVLGSGTASVAFQRFRLPHAPLTYVRSEDPSGSASTLQVRVNDVLWHEVPTLYAASAGDRSFVVRVNEHGETYVQFGDGRKGSRLPTGNGNVRGIYRKGIGSAGNLKPGVLSQLLDRPLGVKGATNPVPASGGSDPESDAEARSSMPLGVRTLGRAVSLIDYEDFARGFAGITKAHAAVLPLRAGKTIVVSVMVAGTPDEEADDRLQDLETSLRRYGDPRVQIQVVLGVRQLFRAALRVRIHPDLETERVLREVDAALHRRYAEEVRGFADPVYRSEILRDVHAVPGLLGVDVDRLYGGETPMLLDRILAQRPAVSPNGTAIPASVLVIDPGRLDWLEPMV